MKKTTVVYAIAFALTSFVYAIAFALNSFANYPEKSQTQFIEQTNSIYRPEQDANLPPAAADAPGGRRGGTGSRSQGCRISSSGKQIKLTLTPRPFDTYLTSGSPLTIMVNVKYELDQVEKVISGKLLLEDPDTNIKLEPSPFELPRTSGNFSIPLPEGFDPDKKYYWYLEIDECEFELLEQNFRQ